MKIALTIERFSASRGGGEVFARRFARALADLGHEVHVYAGDGDEPMPGVQFHAVSVPRGRSLRRARFARRCAEAVQEDTFDIVHGFGKSTYMDVFRPGGGVHRAWMKQDLMAMASGLKRWLAQIRRWMSPDQWSVLRLEREQLGKEDGPHIIAVSRMTRQHMIQYYGTPPERITAIYNGVDLERFHPRNRGKSRQGTRERLGVGRGALFLFVAHNFRLKGLGALVRALPLVEARDYRVVVVGRGRPAPYRRLARRLGCEEQIMYYGPASDTAPLYAAADALIHPSFYDPCANVCLEALASGLPVLTSPFNGSGEIITQGQEGFVVDPRDHGAVADCITRLLDPNFRRDASDAARALAERFSMEWHVGRVIRVYESVLEQKRKRRAPEARSL